MKKFTLYLGLNDQKTLTPVCSTEAAVQIVSDEVIRKFEGGTITTSLGCYIHGDGRWVKESTVRIELLFTTRPAVKEFCKWLKEKFNQESIAVEETDVNSELV